MRVLITGASGFVGRHALSLFQNPNNRLLVISRQLSTPQTCGSTTWLTADLSELDLIGDTIANFNPEAVLHLAWEGIPDFSYQQTVRNLNLTLDLFDIVKTCSACSRFVFVGSCWEYGSRTGIVHEDLPAISPSFFAATKTALHNMLSAAAKDFDIDVVTPRLFFVYGEGQREQSLVPSVIQSLRNGVDPKIKNPNAAQDFIHVSDVAKALSILTLHSNVRPGIYNVGSGELCSVTTVVSTCQGLLRGEKITKTSNSIPSGLFADITKMNSLGWEPQTRLEQGISLYIKSEAS